MNNRLYFFPLQTSDPGFAMYHTLNFFVLILNVSQNFAHFFPVQ